MGEFPAILIDSGEVLNDLSRELVRS